MATIAAISGAVAGVGVMALLFRPVFGDWEEFVDCVKFWFTPDILSLFVGEYLGDRWSELKLVFWVVCGLLAETGVYVGLTRLFG
jgi:hypothetical protein